MSSEEGKTYRFVEEGADRGDHGAHYVKHWWQKLGVGIFVAVVLVVGGSALHQRQVTHEMALTKTMVEAAVASEARDILPFPQAPASEPAPIPEPPKGEAKSAQTPILHVKSSALPVEVATAKPRTQPVAAAKPFEGVARYHSSTQAIHLSPDPGAFVPLEDLPEVALEALSYQAKSVEEAKHLIQELASDIAFCNKKSHDRFVLNLRERRADLSGLPFLLGNACRADKTAAAALAAHSTMIRGAFSSVDRRSRPSMHSGYDGDRSVAFWNLYGEGLSRRARVRTANLSSVEDGTEPLREGMPALRQILAAEDATFRTLFADYLRGLPEPAVAETLAHLAVFDPSGHVRHDALEALIARPREQYGQVILDGLRYPWLPIAERAAHAAIFLQRDDFVPQLVRMLDQADPLAPVVKDSPTGQVREVREIVRINHNRNCLLCHPPMQVAERTRDTFGAFPVGAVPVPGEPIPPPTSQAYYDSQRLPKGTILARADVTYLRQDFSVMLPVANPGRWPEKQRFDFLVRTRQLSEQEAARWPASRNVHREYILQTLRFLTGKDLGPDTAAWRAEVARLEAVSSRFDRSRCEK